MEVAANITCARFASFTELLDEVAICWSTAFCLSVKDMVFALEDMKNSLTTGFDRISYVFNLVVTKFLTCWKFLPKIKINGIVDIVIILA
jgi:hypothetical protein